MHRCSGSLWRSVLTSVRPLSHSHHRAFNRGFRSYPSFSAMAQEFKLKGLDRVSLKDGEKEEFEIEGIENGKVLLAKVSGKVFAVTPKCTHYGAPLKNGVLTSDGRITCPWHGACFSVKTGDIEDAPAPDPLGTFEVVEKDGAVFVRGDGKVLENARKQPNIQCSPSESESVVVVGGGSGAMGVVEELRERGFKGKVTMLTKEGTTPIDRTKISKALLSDPASAMFHSPQVYEDAGIEVIREEVSGVDFAGKSVKGLTGRSYPYTKLVLASGGTPRWLPLEGLKQGALKNVFVLRELIDAQHILAAAGDNGKKIVVIGSSFIGMEVGNCLAGKKNDVTIVGMESEPLERVMGPKVGNIFKKLLEKNGVKFYMGASVDKATPSANDSGSVGAVHLKDGTVLECDLVIEGVGVGPATDYLRDSSEVKLEKDGSLAVDASWAVKGLKDVYAIGDIASFPYHGPGGNGGSVRIEHWNVAQNGGRSVAHTILGKKAKDFIPVFWSALGSQMRYCGNTMVSGYDDLIFVGDAEKPSWVAYYYKGETVVAVASMMKDPYMVKSAELMRLGKMPTKSELEKGVDVLEVAA